MGWSGQEIVRATGTKGKSLPRVRFTSDGEECPECRGPVRIQKSRRRRVVTLAHGAFEALEILKTCGHSECRPLRPEALCQLVRPGQRFGYDLIVHVGLRRYLGGEQREEIREALLDKHRICLSTGTISTLCDRFLSLLEALHIHRAPELSAAQVGGYPLHIDATCERGKGGLFVCMDGWRRWVLGTGRVDTEAAEHVRPIIARTLALFGNPIAVVRDMGSGASTAVAPLRDAGVPDLICHYHFLAAIGIRLLDRRHRALRGMIGVAGTRTKLRMLLADLKAYTGSPEGRFGPGKVRESFKALILWILESDGRRDAPFPFALPHLDFVRRCRQAVSRADQWVPCPRTQPERRAIRHLAHLATRLERDQRLPSIVEGLEERWRLFCELRDVLRLSKAELPRGRSHFLPQQIPALELLRLEQIKQGVEDYQAELERSLPPNEKSAKRPSSPQGLILRTLKRHGSRLFGHPARIGSDGQIAAVVDRTNNTLEQFFGEEKRRLRRRLGRAQLGRDLEQQPAQVALVANLRSAAYTRVLCGSLDNLPRAFAALDGEMMVMTGHLGRDHRDKHLQDHVRKLIAGSEVPSGRRLNPLASSPISLPGDSDLQDRWLELEHLSAEELRARAAALFAPSRKNGSKGRDCRLPPPGTVLSRRFGNRTHRVLVGEDGFEYGGERYAGLSGVAKRVTGTTYNGYRFFRLTLPWNERPAKAIRRKRRRRAVRNVPVTTET
ncbi:MAG: DUF2924 domain-containing protein [Candidatus Eisenbacteria bacterium]|nr:DUF2924 domain-containing protein [Candidatus Eisenbacteria bacterium]